MKKQKVTEFYLLDTSVLKRVSIDLPKKVYKNVPWLVSSKSKVKKVIKTVNKSALESVLIVNPDTGKVVAAITGNYEVALECAKKKKWRKLRKDGRAYCTAQLPGCRHILATLKMDGTWDCQCLDEATMDSEFGDFYEGL